MKKIWHERAWEDYLYCQTQDKRLLKKVNNLLRDIERNGYACIGKPEPLTGDFSGYWSVRIDEKNRLIFRLENDLLEIAQCGMHYSDK